MNQGSESTSSTEGGRFSDPLRFVVAFVIFGGLLAAAPLAGGIYAFLAPREFYSYAIVEVTASPYSEPGKLAPQSIPPKETIRSREVLLPVIQNLKLAETWGAVEGGLPLSEKDAYERLVNKVRAEQFRNSPLIEIGTWSNDRVEAANIANSVVASYQKLIEKEQAKILETESAAKGTNAQPSIQAKLLRTALTPPKICAKAEPAIYPARPYVSKIMAFAVSIGVLAGIFSAGIFLLLTRPHKPPFAPAQIFPRQ